MTIIVWLLQEANPILLGAHRKNKKFDIGPVDEGWVGNENAPELDRKDTLAPDVKGAVP